MESEFVKGDLEIGTVCFWTPIAYFAYLINKVRNEGGAANDEGREASVKRGSPWRC